MCRLCLAELCGLVINGQERRFHYAGMSGVGVGKEPAPFPASASPAALIDVPCITAAPPPLTPPGARPAARCSWTLGSWDGGREGRPGGSHPDVELLPPSLWHLDAGGVGSAVDLWPMATSPWDLTVQNWGWWSSPALFCWERHITT